MIVLASKINRISFWLYINLIIPKDQASKFDTCMYTHLAIYLGK